MLDNTPSPAPANQASNPWKCWATIGLSLVIGMAALSAQVVFAAVWAIIFMLKNGSEFNPDQLTSDGGLLLGSTLISYPFVIGLMILFIKMRPGNSLVDYLALRKTGAKSILVWGAWLCAFFALSAVLDPFIKEDPAAFITAMLLTAPRWLVILLLVVAAPIVEELFFRGFLFKGIAASRIGGAGAVTITTLAWTGVHGFQYGWIALLYLALLGIILGMARLKTGSIMVPTILHVVNNLLAVAVLLTEHA